MMRYDGDPAHRNSNGIQHSLALNEVRSAMIVQKGAMPSWNQLSGALILTVIHG
jgi:hypothetical protein